MKRMFVVSVFSVILAGCVGVTPASNEPASPVASAQIVPTAAAPTRTPAPSASEPAAPTGLVAYSLGHGVRVIDADGTDDRPLLPGVSDAWRYPVAWSADGSRLLYTTGHGFGLTDAAGLEPLEFTLQCPDGRADDARLAACQPDESGVALSPDGGRVAYTVWEGSFDRAVGGPTAVMVILDVATGAVARLAATESTAAKEADCGGNHAPAWSPDATHIVFTREAAPTSGSAHCGEAILTVDVDGGDMRQIVDAGDASGQLSPSWSPDGSHILIDGFVDISSTRRKYSTDVYTVRPDGTDFSALTSDGVSSRASWTRDGRITFIRWLSTASETGGDQWIMDADGGNATPLATTIPALTAAGCLKCRYPVERDGIDPFKTREPSPLKRYEGTTLLWQP